MPGPIKITTHTDSMTVDFNGMSQDRKKARIKYDAIRSIVADTDDASVEIVFTSGEIYKFPYTAIEWDTVACTDQDDLYGKVESKVFAP